MLEAMEGWLYSLEVLEVLEMLEAMEGRLCLLDAL
jgi:hypothetical protein